MVELILFFLIIFIIGMTFKLWRPNIDKLSDGSVVLWYTEPFSGTRKFEYLWKQKS